MANIERVTCEDLEELAETSVAEMAANVGGGRVLRGQQVRPISYGTRENTILRLDTIMLLRLI